MSRTPLYQTLLAAACTWLCACAINPVTGERELILMSPQQEAAQGAQAAPQVAEQMGLVTDPALNAYVSAIGNRLATVSPRQDVQYRFFVVDMPEANAFALPGGYIYVSRGLLELCNSEEELANVIGHEIGHVAARHSAQRQTRATGIGLLSVLGQVLAGAYGGEGAAQTVGQIGQIAGAGLIASYGRDQEREADRVGQGMAAQTGWDPAGMTRFLNTLERDTTLQHGSTRAPSFLDSHPATPERVANTAELARSLPRAAASPIAVSRADFLARLQGVMLGPNPEEGVIDGSSFLHAGLDFQMRFPSEWKVQNGKSAVGAIKPDGSARIVLEGQGRGSDAAAAASAFLGQQPVQVADQGARRIGALRAYRVVGSANSQGGTVGLDLTWIAHRGSIFRITGATSAANLQSYIPLFDRSARSFRPLTQAELNSFREHRLSVATARSGETIAALSQRTGNTWSVEKTAIANNLTIHDRLRAGQRLKISVARAYRPGG